MYLLIFKTAQRHLQQSAKHCASHFCTHTHNRISTLSRQTFRINLKPSSIVCSFLCAQTRGISLDTGFRNKATPDEREKVLVYKYRGGTPKSSATQKVKEAGRDFTYLIVVLIGLGVTGGLLYVVFQELFSSSSPNKVYGKAFDKVRLHPEVIGAFGEPIKCYGETTRRGRRQQVSNSGYLKDGLKHLRLKFYIEGSEPGLKGTVHSESKENPETGKYEFRYIFVEVDTYPRRTIIVEDNR